VVDRKRQIESLFDGGRALQSGEIARVLGVTRQTAHRHLRQLVAEGRLIAEGAGRGSRYRRSSAVDQRIYPTAGLEEDLVWSETSGAGSLLGTLPRRANTILLYALTELVNNVIDHSGAAEVEIRVSEEGGSIELVVRDRGIGIFELSRTRTVIKLFAIGTEFVSRSQAKRLLHGLAKFREVVLDFAGVDLVGQGFADEVFRIWAREHPEVNLVPTEMSDPVAFMVERALRGASALGSDPR